MQLLVQDREEWREDGDEEVRGDMMTIYMSFHPEEAGSHKTSVSSSEITRVFLSGRVVAATGKPCRLSLLEK